VDRAQEQREGEKLQGVRPEKLWHMLGEGRRGGGGESSQRHKKGEVETDQEERGTLQCHFMATTMGIEPTTMPSQATLNGPCSGRHNEPIDLRPGTI
jgi:hypothetical protein